jgi:hypothetical protein
VPRADACAAVVNGKVYVVGAWQQQRACYAMLQTAAGGCRLLLRSAAMRDVLV